jgi:VWFA-related protein
MTSRVFPLLFALAAVVLSLTAQEPDVVFRSDVSLVRVDAQVVDRDNRAITGLRVSDFILREDGRPQPIRNFASENMPVDVLFLLDVSASMRPHVQRIADAAHQALRVLADQDRMAIMVFDRQTRLRMPFRASRRDVEREFEALLDHETFRGGTDITRGLLDAANYVGREGRRDARRAIVILTDDQTEFNRDEAAVSRALTRADAVLCALIAPDAMQYRSGLPGGGGGGIPQGGGGGSWPGSGPTIGGPLGGIILGRPRPPYGGRGGGPVSRGPRTKSAGTAEIARASGGDSMSVDDSYALQNTLERIRQRYALYFNLPPGVKAGQERAIDVSLADSAHQRYPNSEVRYRRVYLAPVDGGPSSGAPAEITQVPVGASGGNGEPAAVYRDAGPRRRPAVGDTPVSRQGPLDVGGSSTPDPPAKSSPSDSRPPAADPAPTQGGWRKATPEDQKSPDPK